MVAVCAATKFLICPLLKRHYDVLFQQMNGSQKDASTFDDDERHEHTHLNTSPLVCLQLYSLELLLSVTTDWLCISPATTTPTRITVKQKPVIEETTSELALQLFPRLTIDHFHVHRHAVSRTTLH